MTPHEAYLFRLFWPVMVQQTVTDWRISIGAIGLHISMIALRDDARSRLFLRRMGEVFQEALDGSGEGG